MLPKHLGLAFLAAILSLPGTAYSEEAPATPDMSEPVPPGVPQPEPEPQPIPKPQPRPIQQPFPEESDAEKIQKLTQENEALKSQNSELRGINDELRQEITYLKQIMAEQIRVILQLLDQIKQTVFAPDDPENSA